MTAQVLEKIKSIDSKLNLSCGYDANNIENYTNELINKGRVEVGYRAQAGATHSTQKTYREFIKVVKLLKKLGYEIKEEPVKHGNAYATINGGFWNSTIFTISSPLLSEGE